MDVEAQRRWALGCELVAEVARRFGEVRLKVTGASMLPCVRPSDVLIVRYANSWHLRPGHIVLYHRQGELVAHRVIASRRDQLITRGDMLPQSDPPVEASDIVGRVVCIIRNGRRKDPEQSYLQRTVSSILRRSDFCMRLTLCVVRRLRVPQRGGMSWVS